MKRFYSFVVWSPGEVPLPEMGEVLERGQTAFNGFVDDIDAFKNKLSANGVRLIRYNILDDHTPLPKDSLYGGLLQDVHTTGAPQLQSDVLVPIGAENPVVLEGSPPTGPFGGDFLVVGDESEGNGSDSNGPR
jgi:hypothetical protein